jgi:hypothetical protein
MQLALSRQPTGEEITDAMTFMKQQTALHTQTGSKAPEAQEKALIDFCIVLFNTSQFVYVD